MSTMRLVRIRRGFATNSSSTHSILEVEPGQQLPPPLNVEWGDEHNEGDDFVVSDPQSRLNYLHAMAADAARDGGDWRDDDACYRRYLQLAAVIPGPPLRMEKMCEIHLDSLSGYGIPRKIHSPDMDVDFFERIVRFLMSGNIVIFGDRWLSIPPWEKKLKGQYVHLLDSLHAVSRRVGENEWTVLNRYDGTKYGVTFDNGGRQTTTPMDASIRALEMVDVSISDACDRQCPFCYRGSLPEGDVADIENLKALVAGLKEALAMEVVIGGGEPTAHPDFYRFLKDTDFGDLAVSFTTRNLDFVRSLARSNGVEEGDVVGVIRKKIKAIGLSVRTAADVKNAESNLAVFWKHDFEQYASNPQMVFHVIPGAGWQELLDAIIQGKHRMLLLGMKFTGRNSAANRESYAEVLEAMLKDERFIEIVSHSLHSGRARLGVDTKLIVDILSVAPEWLQRFSRKSWSDEEGARSAFIDLVDGTMAPCSFGGKVVKMDGYDEKGLSRAFERIGAYKPESL